MKEQDIRDIWKSRDHQGPDFSVSEVEAIIENGSKNIIEKFIRNLKVELTISVVSMLGASGIMLYKQYWFWSLFFVFFSALLITYYLRLIRNLNQAFFADVEVLPYLQEVRKIVGKFIMHYHIFNVFQAVVSYALTYYILSHSSNMNGTLSDAQVHLFSLAFIATLIGATYILLYFMYGKKSRQLTEMIDSLSSEEG